MQLFNTFSQQIETFVARDDEVKLYVCGITPYDTAHLGHALVFATFDILVRYLRSQGLRVVYVENVTDIDEPLFEKARELGNISWDQLAQQETESFVREMQAIHVVMPDHFVRASEQLPIKKCNCSEECHPRPFPLAPFLYHTLNDHLLTPVYLIIRLLHRTTPLIRHPMSSNLKKAHHLPVRAGVEWRSSRGACAALIAPSRCPSRCSWDPGGRPPCYSPFPSGRS